MQPGQGSTVHRSSFTAPGVLRSTQKKKWSVYSSRHFRLVAQRMKSVWEFPTDAPVWCSAAQCNGRHPRPFTATTTAFWTPPLPHTKVAASPGVGSGSRDSLVKVRQTDRWVEVTDGGCTCRTPTPAAPSPVPRTDGGCTCRIPTPPAPSLARTSRPWVSLMTLQSCDWRHGTDLRSSSPYMREPPGQWPGTCWSGNPQGSVQGPAGQGTPRGATQHWLPVTK